MINENKGSRIEPPYPWARENTKDLELKKELEKIDWSKYIEYGSIKVQVRQGKKTLTTIERTYPD